MNKCRCINSIFRAEYLEVDSYTIKDKVSGKIFIMCPKCWNRISKLAGYQIVAYPRSGTVAKHIANKPSSTPF